MRLVYIQPVSYDNVGKIFENCNFFNGAKLGENAPSILAFVMTRLQLIVFKSLLDLVCVAWMSICSYFCGWETDPGDKSTALQVANARLKFTQK